MQTSLLRGTALATVFALTAFGVSAQEIKVGSVAAVTGPIPDLIAPIVVSRNLAAKHVNDQGGLLDGQTLTLVLADGQCDAKAAVDAGNKVVNVDQVVAVIGASCSGETSGLAQSVTIPAGIVSVSDSATAPSISELDDNDLVYRVAASDAYQGISLAKLALESGYNNIAVTFANDDYNAGIAKVFEQAVKDMGGTITASQMHEPKAQSYRSELATLSGAGDADVLAVFAYYGSSGITIMRNSLENGLFDTFLGADGMLDDSVIEQIGADNLKDKVMMTRAASTTESDAYKRFADEYAATGNDPSGPYIGQGYDATFLMALAIEKAGAADRSKIKDALRAVANPPGVEILPGEWKKAKEAIAAGEDINYVGASGAVDFDEAGDVAGVFGVSVVGDCPLYTSDAADD